MSHGQSNYQSIREQLVSLQVDLDDKQKICQVLDQKVKQERAKLGRVEEETNEEYQQVLERYVTMTILKRVREERYRVISMAWFVC
jgi:hypothetical protein